MVVCDAAWGISANVTLGSQEKSQSDAELKGPVLPVWRD